MAGTAQKILIREAFIGLGLAIAGGAVWKVAVAAPTTRTYKAYYRNLEKYEAEHPKQPTPEQTEIEEKLYELFKQLKAEQGGAEGTGEATGSEEEE